jgi:hypothetical protein
MIVGVLEHGCERTGPEFIVNVKGTYFPVAVAASIERELYLMWIGRHVQFEPKPLALAGAGEAAAVVYAVKLALLEVEGKNATPRTV